MPRIADELIVRVGLQGADQTIAGLKQIGTAGASLGNQIGALSMRTSELFYSFHMLSGAVAGALYSFVALSGIRTAEQFIRIRQQLSVLTGSTSEANRMLEEFIALGQKTIFDTAQVAAFANMLYSAGVSGENLRRELSAILDLAAGLGVAREDMWEFTRNIMQIRSGSAALIDIKQLFRVAPGAGAVIGAGLGTGRLTMEQVADEMASRGGQAIYDALVSGAQQLMRGAAERLTPLVAISNLLEAFGIAFKSTGELILKIITPIVSILTKLVNAFGTLNKALGGVPGLFIAIAGAAIPMIMIIGTVRRALSLLATAINLASARIAASSALPMPAAAGGLGAILGRFKGIGGIIGGIGRFGRFGFGVGTILSGLLPILGTALEGVIGGRAGEFLRHLGALAGGALSGAGLGSLAAPGIGTMLGFLGGLGASAIGVWRELQGRNAPVVNAAEREIAANTRETARQLKDLNMRMTGGGQMGSYIISRLEMELALARLLAGGVG